MTDPLGQSQVIPYLAGLTAKGYEIFLISCEKKFKETKEYSEINSYLISENIKWFPLSYTSKPPVLSTVFDIWKINRLAKKIIRNYKIDAIHCRSYIAALTGLKMKNKFGTKFIFDMRGFFADERVDGNLWNIKNPLYKQVYNYFKKKEKLFFTHADYIISLTKSAKEEILKWKLSSGPLKIKVIPCCADLKLFNKKNIDDNKKNKWFEKFKIQKADFIISYLGSIGTWYLLDEMLDFFKVLSNKKESAKFLFITHENPENILEKAKQRKISTDKIIIQKANRYEVPELLALSNISMFFIKPVFSKKASSPTKMGEIMGMGIPLICNGNVGDVDLIMNETKSGIVVDAFDNKEYNRVINEIENLLQIPSEIICAYAEKYFSLEKGIEKYDEVYKSLMTIENEQ